MELAAIGDEVEFGDLALCYGEPEHAQGLVPGAATLAGFCERTITADGATAHFRQDFSLPQHRGWNPVVADFSVPHPGRIIANLKTGTGPHEKWYSFMPAAR